MSKKVLIYGLPVLRKNAERITKKDNILELVRNLFSTPEVEGGILFIDRDYRYLQSLTCF
ncbi:MAG TPA: hypothetical protein VFC87_08520 [Perlabentimonas sp.]|nr:hypothetical protein [Bacteroidales bacterium]MDD4672944.1 hypothetical protein [Bacteroidales bacterium]MDY0348908.1 hypothetical protein [Tenuifilaceae bacterium]HZJ74833.1 hypothetical protein [Perlabentimonas sp.]